MMKKYLPLCLLLGSLAGSQFAVASPAPALPQVPPAAPAPCRPGARPLVRYLTATLRLTPTQVAAVQQALRTDMPRSLVPEQLAQSLSPVLSPEAQERLHALQTNVDSYRTLYYLAARH
jgi:hypothetical protein